jgi:hypothetical protein
VSFPQEEQKIEGQKNKSNVPVINVNDRCSVRQTQAMKLYDREYGTRVTMNLNSVLWDPNDVALVQSFYARIWR